MFGIEIPLSSVLFGAVAFLGLFVLLVWADRVDAKRAARRQVAADRVVMSGFDSAAVGEFERSGKVFRGRGRS